MRTNSSQKFSGMNNTDFLILNLLKKNRLGQLFLDKFKDAQGRLGASECLQVSLLLKHFKRIGLEIHMPALNIHRCLKNNRWFIRDKELLKSCNARTGLILLPDRIKGLNANAIFYDWRMVIVAGVENPKLFFLPFLDDDLAPELKVSSLSSDWSEYGSGELGFYAGVHEYLMNLILLNTFSKIYDAVLLDPGLRRIPSIVNSNLVEIIFQAVI